MATTKGNCSCLWGEVVTNQDGSCGCTNPGEPIKVPAGGVRAPKVPPLSLPAGAVPVVNQTPSPAADAEIFGLPRGLVILGCLGVGLYFLSQMDGKK